jgi:MoaA/NifB/PqqE/SkfB family radical SAM enzyme
MIKESERYNQDNKYPGVIIYSYMTSHRSVGCACGTSYLYVSPYGEVMPCDFNHASFGSITKEPLYKIWQRLTGHSDYKQASWGGCKIKNSEFRSKSSVATETSNYFDCKSCEEKSGGV